MPCVPEIFDFFTIFGDASGSLDYRFSTVQQYMAILETMGYECYRQDDAIILKRAGLVQDSVPLSMVESRCQSSSATDQRRKPQLRDLLQFQSRKERFRRMESFIDQMLEDNRNQPLQPVQKPNIMWGIRKVLQQSGGSKDANREHEVGSHDNYDDIDDERHLKR